MSAILVVDDSQLQRQMTVDLLTAQGFEVETAQDGIEALAAVDHAPPDLIILDVVMPRLSGFEVCRRLKTRTDTHNIPIIMYSSNTDQVSRHWCMKQGADAYVVKPMYAEELVRLVKQLIQTRSPQSSPDRPPIALDVTRH